MLIDSKEESAALKLQYWWRRKLRQDEHNARSYRERSQLRQLTSISLHDDQLTQRLSELRKSKRYEMMKYEHILNLPASEVNRYLRKETDNPTDASTEEERILEQIESDRRNRAATIIQKSFRRYYIQRQGSRYLRRITMIKPTRRLQLLEQINDRIGQKRYIRNDALHDIKTRLTNHLANREKDALIFVQQRKQLTDYKREMAMITVLVNRTSVNSQLMAAIGSTTPLATQKATMEHKQCLDDIDEKHLFDVKYENFQ